MANFDDFTLDVTASKDDAKKADAQITSKFLCTPGCVTGWLMGCNGSSASCNCSVTIDVK
ncbi:MAG: gallidermin/nisin family lantibiotic [Lachnospiraceae bacterium]|nr:gallidermin/nisin family lantibiotic [Lachnospiraceae bacterium]